MANEMTIKNALCNNLDDLVINGGGGGDDIDKLTIPLNGHHSPSSATPTGANIIHSNIYSSGPLSTSNVNGGSMMATNKHVTWRPETPPSPNIYTVSFIIVKTFHFFS
ncbi:hypothetical protein BLA29_014751 [Euroglyphus maynei]|uniref:Uncharacterized protein n=1 Tax=Euroglyphus maynei TaxID=6958 RepID=A0A1Y3ASJ8_EURMA|nr:hypothetical protein BLA29_014751 [Euroglyphus maynei]